MKSVAARVGAFLAFIFVMGCSTAPVQAAGALAYGKCGVYGQAFDFGRADNARAAALRRCKGECTAVPMAKACVAFSVDMANPCGSHGFAVARHISGAQNNAMRECYKHGGKTCVIRAWACDARG